MGTQGALCPRRPRMPHAWVPEEDTELSPTAGHGTEKPLPAKHFPRGFPSPFSLLPSPPAHPAAGMAQPSHRAAPGSEALLQKLLHGQFQARGHRSRPAALRCAPRQSSCQLCFVPTCSPILEPAALWLSPRAQRREALLPLPPLISIDFRGISIFRAGLCARSPSAIHLWREAATPAPSVPTVPAGGPQCGGEARESHRGCSGRRCPGCCVPEAALFIAAGSPRAWVRVTGSS